jgi:ribosomal protein L40E
MDTSLDAKTVAVKSCTACAGGLLEYDKFCRWCGARQPDDAAPMRPTAPCRQQMLRTNSKFDSGRLNNRVSGPLINAMIEGMASGRPAREGGSLIRGAMLALISIPVWLMIVLLSPLDAFVAARSLVRQV